MAKNPKDGKRLALHADEVFETSKEKDMGSEDILGAGSSENSDGDVLTGMGGEVYVSLDSDELKPPSDTIKATEVDVPEEIQEACAVTDIMIALAQSDYSATEEECKKVLGALKEQGCPLTNENIVAAFEDLNFE